jgi:phosphoglycerol geranylgeranyltransferase
LIDPVDQSPCEAAQKARRAEEMGTDGIMVGGSTVSDREIVFETVESIRAVIKIPIILFPNCADAVCEGADYIFFMMLLNSKNINFLIGEQLKGAPLVKKFGIKPISVGYMIISTGEKPTTVEKIAQVDKITSKEIEKAVNYALIAQYWGMEYIYLEAGSGAENPVSDEMISDVRDAVEIPVIVGGGIKDSKAAIEKIKAGARIIVTGNIGKDLKRLNEIVSAVNQY